MTELASAVCVNLSKEIGRIGSVGIPFIKTTVAAFDVETNKELPYDNIGEICISGPSIMIGYLNNQLATNEMIRLHSDGKKWLHTGDLGHIDQDGFIFIDGRIKRMIVRENGAKVFPSEVERVVLEIPEVMDCVVVSKKESDTSLGSVPVAYVVIQGSNNRDDIKSEILSHCKKELQNYAIPRYIQIIEDIPLTPVGKIDYRALEKQAEVMIHE